MGDLVIGGMVLALLIAAGLSLFLFWLTMIFHSVSTKRYGWAVIMLILWLTGFGSLIAAFFYFLTNYRGKLGHIFFWISLLPLILLLISLIGITASLSQGIHAQTSVVPDSIVQLSQSSLFLLLFIVLICMVVMYWINKPKNMR